MDFKKFLKQEFHLKGMPVNKEDIKYIEELITTVVKEQSSLDDFPELKNEVPMTIVDKGELFHD